MSLSNVSPCLWTAVETGFNSISEVEKRVVSMESDLKEMSTFVLENVYPPDLKGDNSDDGTNFVKSQFNLSTPGVKILDTRRNKSHSETDCDSDVSKCSLCMAHIDALEKKILTTSSRIANLEDVKSGSIESALMIKEHGLIHIFR